MRDVLETLAGWAARGERIAAATLVATERSTPRLPGSVFAVTEDGDVAGSVTGGCVEPALVAEAQELFAGGEPRLLTYGIPDEDAFDVGLPCGGTVHVFLARLENDLVAELARAVRAEEPVVLELELAGAGAGTARLRPAAEREETRREGDLFLSAFLPRPRLYVFGALDHSAALARVGRLLGFHVTVSDARKAFAAPERFPDADEVVLGWPDEVLARAQLDERSAVCVLTHDHKLDIPALEAALASPAGYVGAMGSRRTNEERARILRERGVGEAALARLRAPIGLDIGSRTPEEVAVAIGAELVAVFRGRDGAGSGRG